MYSVGIDAGRKGAIAWIWNGEYCNSVPMSKDNLIDVIEALMATGEPVRVCLEKVHAMPKQGSVSMFTFGEGYGYIKGVLDTLHVPYQEIHPQKWKKEFSLSKDKAESIEVCKQLFPTANLRPVGTRKDQDGIAEAILMAEYARRKL